MKSRGENPWLRLGGFLFGGLTFRDPSYRAERDGLRELGELQVSMLAVEQI